jgi:hypothetical protein
MIYLYLLLELVVSSFDMIVVDSLVVLIYLETIKLSQSPVALILEKILMHS